MILRVQNEFYGRMGPVERSVDAKCLWDCATGLKKTTEERVLVKLSKMQKAYELREVSNAF